MHRLGFGAMRIVGDGVWGEPADRNTAIAVVRRAVELGVDFIDTADSYGPNISEEILAEALHPYRDDLLIATKVGFTRTGPNEWVPVGRPEYLRQQTELSLRKLKVDALDLLQLHRIDPKVDPEEQFSVLRDLQKEGKVKALGLSQVSVAELEQAGRYFTVSTVQNRYKPDGPQLGRRPELRREERHRLHPLGSDLGRRTRPARRPARRGRHPAGRHHLAGGPRLAASPLPRDDADPRHRLDQAPRREPCRRRRRPR